MTTSRPPLRDSYEGILERARASIRSDDMEGALALYHRLVEKLSGLSDRILARRPELRDLHLQASLELTTFLRAEARYGEAIEVLNRLVDSHPDDAYLWRREIAILHNAKGDVQRGLGDLQALADERPDDIRNWLTLAREARIEGRFNAGEAALQRALQLSRGDADQEVIAEVHYQRFRLLADMGRIDAALASWEEALSSHSDVGATVREVYSLLTEAGRYSEAKRYIARDSNELQAGFQRGLIASLTANGSAARQEWRTVARLDPTDYDSGHDAWAEAVLRLGDPDPALEKLQGLLQTKSEPRLLILSGIAWAMRDDPELAAVLFQRAISVLRRGRPPRQKLESSDWHLLDSLVSDGKTKAALKPYFAVIDRLWDQPAVPPRLATA